MAAGPSRRVDGVPHPPPGSATQDAPAPVGTIRRRTRRAWLLLAVATAFGTVLVSPYLLLDIHSSRVALTSEAHYAVLVVHVFAACVALVLGPLQFIPTIRARRRVHRVIGRLYLFAGVLPGAVAAVPVALLSGRLMTQVGLTIPAVLWLVTGTLAYRAARRHDYLAHRNWMIRNYALTFLAVTSRILVPLLLLARIPFTDASRGSLGHDATSMIRVGQVLGWIVDLAVAEVLIRRRRQGAS